MLAIAPSNKKLKFKIIKRKPDISYTVLSEIVKSSLTSVDHEDTVKSVGNEEKLQSTSGSKRSAEEMIDDCSSKRLKMDPVMAEKSLVILKKLTKHPYGLCFKLPVDPVAYELPHYFSIISKPMDLGTIESKLVKGLYATAQEFEADIRLTFSNAMRYHPSDHAFHRMANELNTKFSAEWSGTETSKAKADNGKKIDPTSGCIVACSRRPVLLTDQKEVMHSNKVVVQKLPPNKRLSKVAPEQGSFPVNSGSKSSGQKTPPKSTKKMVPKRNNSESLHKRPTTKGQKDISSLSGARTTILKPPSNALKTLENIVSEEANTRTPLENLVKKTVPRVVSTHKRLEKWDNYANYEDRRSPTCGIPISPVRAMRTEMLKKRFANIILKAQDQTLLCPDTRTQKTNCSLQRQQQRKAARLALEKVERTVEFDDNMSSLRYLENMIGPFCFTDPLRLYDTNNIRNPLERLGLYLKEDLEFMLGEDQCHNKMLPQDYEEGEIIG